MKRVTDEQGNVYMVDDNGVAHPASPNTPMSEGGAGLTKTPSLADLAKKQGQDIAQKQLGKQVEGIVEGAGGNSAATQLPSLASAAPITPATASVASQDGWNAAALGADTPAAAAPGHFALSGIGSAGNAILPAAGLAGAYDLWANKPQNVGHGSGYLEGAASGAAIGSYAGPWGALIGAGVGITANALGIGHKSATHLEEDHRKQLADQGIVVPNSDIKEWENNPVFAKSRNEADLTGKDIMHSAQLYGIKGYAQADAAKQESIANEALKEKLIREEHGQIDVNLTPEYQKYLATQLSAPSSSGGSPGRRPQQQQDNRAQVAEAKKERKRSILSQIMPELDTPTTVAPNYGQINVGNLIKNPYL